MSDSILADPARAPQLRADLLCPQLSCQAPLSFVPEARRLGCSRCGWSCALSAEECADLTDALAGITDLPLPVYLRILSLAARPTLGEGGSG
jgi:hypothetical protein